MSTFREEGDETLDDLLKPLDGEAGPARRISRQKSAALVSAALAAAAVNEAAPSQRFIRKPKRPPMWLMAGALILTGATAAAVWKLTSSEPMSEPQAVGSVEQHRPASTDVAAAAGGGARAEVAPLPVPPDGIPVSGTPSAADASAERPLPAETSGRAEAEKGSPSAIPAGDGEAPSSVRKPRDAVARTAPSPALPLAAAGASDASTRAAEPSARTSRRQDAPAPVAAPEDLLRKANELRAGGRWKEAEALYLRIIRAEPSSLASYVARVASGSLRLEHLGDARGALRHFQEALRLQPQGVLGQEARHGIAEAHRALGDSPAEARALEAFLSSHPDSPLATTARARLRELSRP